MSQISESEGDNKEFTINKVSDGDVTIFIGSSNTSANDTLTLKYFDNSLTPFNSAKYYQLRNDKTVQIVQVNETVQTDPITSVADKGVIEKYDVPTVWKLIIRATEDNTAIKLRIR